VAINLNTKLKDFEQINPCGLSATVMTSVLKETGKKVSLDRFGEKLLKNYDRLFDTTFESIKLDELAEEMESQRGGDVI
jgi:lipoate-protein ligase B